MVRMSNNALHTVEAHIREQATAYCESNNVPGFVTDVTAKAARTVAAPCSNPARWC